MKKVWNLTHKVAGSYLTLSIILILAVAALILLVVGQTQEILVQFLRSFVGISMAVVVGLGAVTISFNFLLKEKGVSTEPLLNYFRQLLVICGLNLLAIFISYWPTEAFNTFIIPVYSLVIGVLLINLLTNTASFIKMYLE
ncbi:hypothetical protein LC040_15615 [Bacillus tianshenii]|nr:hypothetical protein LC040_15615 [Bacillus tianshenii]